METFKESLRTILLDCLENDIFGANDVAGLDISELISRVKNEQGALEDMLWNKRSEESTLKADSVALENATKDLETARGERTTSLADRKQRNADVKQQNGVDIATAEATKKGLASLQYESWAEASKARRLAENAIKDIDDAITTASKAKEEASENETALKSKLGEQKKNLEKLQKDEALYKEKFEKLLSDSKFSSEEEFLGFVVSEKTIKDSPFLQKQKSYSI